jgi:hypothetical protein
VTWNTFAVALCTFKESFSFDKNSLDRIRGHFELDGDGYMDIVEFNVRLSFMPRHLLSRELVLSREHILSGDIVELNEFNKLN